LLVAKKTPKFDSVEPASSSYSPWKRN